MECDYLYIKYSSSFNFSLIIQDMGWQNAYVVNCNSTDNEAYIKLTPGAFPGFTQVVIQNHSEGSIDIAGHMRKGSDMLPDLPRFGLRFFLRPGMDKVSYLGYGPTESYVDKHRACWLGRFDAAVDELHEDEEE